MPSLALTRIVRAAGRSRIGGVAGRAAYIVVAHQAARALARLQSVDGVYATGSVTRFDRIEPGYSDIDLVVLADLPSLQAELTLRRALRRWFDSAAAFAVGNIDYLERRDLDILRHFGNAWALDLDSRWKPLAGNDRLSVPPVRDRHERSLVLLRQSMRRWCKASSRLMADPVAQDAARNARRLLADCLAARLDSDRLAPLSALLDAVGLDTPDPSDVIGHLRGALDVIESHVRTVTAAWAGDWSTEGSAPPEDSVTDHAKRLVDGGMQSVYLGSRDPWRGERLLVAITPDVSTLEAVELGRRAMAAHSLLPPSVFRWVRRPIVLTPALWRAAALIDPSPIVGASLSLPEARVAGEQLDSPPMPDRRDYLALLSTRLVELVHRPRSRALRRTRRAPAHSMGREIAHGETLVDLHRGCPVRFAAEPPDALALSEADLVASLRALLDQVRPKLAADSSA